MAILTKRKAREMLSATLGSSFSQIPETSLMAATVVSIDVFDTLVIRDCSAPEVVFDLVERRYNNLHPSTPLKGFRDARIEAERRARSSHSANDPTIYEIYSTLRNPFADIAQDLLLIELDSELCLCRPNAEAKEFFDKLVHSGMRIALASDMYLPSEWLVAILEKCGYIGYERLFVSNELGCTKRSGGMFRVLCAEMGVDTLEVLHIGDHLYADYVIPKREGIRSFLYRRKSRKLRLFRSFRAIVGAERDSLAEDVLGAMLAHGFQKERSCGWQIGYSVLGPMLLGYTMWLHETCEKEKLSKIWFLSREGRLLKAAYESLYEESAGSESRYINVSRIALCRAMAGAMRNASDLRELFSCLMNGVDTVGDLLEVLGIEPNDEDLRSLNLRVEDELDDSNRMVVFTKAMAWGGAYYDNQRALLDEYLGVQSDDDARIVICDIGWSGTMQALLQRALPHNRTIGMYLAASNLHDGEKSLNRAALDRRGYWCGPDDWEERGVAIRFALSALEALYLGNEGTTLGYEKREGSVVPVKGDGGGALCDEDPAQEIDDGAFAFIDMCKHQKTSELLGTIAPESALLPFFNSIVRTSRQAIKFFAAFDFVTGTKHISFMPRFGLPYYVAHPRIALSELESNNSKTIWLRGLLKLPFPYFELLRFFTLNVGMKSNYEKQVKDQGIL